MKETIVATTRGRLFCEVAERLSKIAEGLEFGSVGVVLTVHGGKVTKCDFTETELKRFEVKEKEV